MFGSENLINTPLQRGGDSDGGHFNRFSGLHSADAAAVVETAEAVCLLLPRSITLLKRGGNERVRHAWTLPVLPSAGRLRPRSAGFQPAVSQVFNLQRGGFYEAPADWKSAVRQAKSLRYESAGLAFGRRSHA